MASTFKFHSQVNETVPWQAQYTFPTQATRINKQIVKLPPKNGSSFTPGQIIRIEFPADNYLNVLNSVLALDVSFASSAGSLSWQRHGAHSAIKRLRILYGSLVLEDIQEYSTLVRIFTEAGVQNEYCQSIGGILDGMYQSGSAIALTNGTTTSYCLNLMSGLLTCKKLIPLKWMAAQFAIEITLASAAEAFDGNSTAVVSGNGYTVSNVNFIAEMLEFDSTYDSAFYAGLVQGGVPLKFSSWHYFTQNISGATTAVQIHERARSVKAGFAVIRQNNTNEKLDTNRFLNSITTFQQTADGTVTTSLTGLINEFQWRVGGRYYPSQPVSCLNNGPEALVELMKTINALGDYRMASGLTASTFAPSTGGGSSFIISSEFENTDVMPDSIAGINAEEQSDINLTIKAAGAPSADTNPGGYKVDVFMHYDCLLIVRDGNVVDLVM